MLDHPQVLPAPLVGLLGHRDVVLVGAPLVLLTPFLHPVPRNETLQEDPELHGATSQSALMGRYGPI